jgi:hypothetical protein
MAGEPSRLHSVNLALQLNVRLPQQCPGKGSGAGEAGNYVGPKKDLHPAVKPTPVEKLASRGRLVNYPRRLGFGRRGWHEALGAGGDGRSSILAGFPLGPKPTEFPPYRVRVALAIAEKKTHAPQVAIGATMKIKITRIRCAAKNPKKPLPPPPPPPPPAFI